MPDRNDARDMLRREGLTSYFDALMAVDEFTRLIQADCRKVLERHAAALHDATGLKFAPKEISDYSEPYNGRGKVWSGQYASIGSMLPVLKSDKFSGTDAGLTWDQEDGPQSPYFYSCFYTQNVSLLDHLKSKFNRDSDRLYVDKADYAIVLWGDLAVDPNGQYRFDALEEVVLKWISMWKKAGGVANVFNGQSRKS